METKNNEKKFAAILSVVSNSSLIILKLAAGIISGSISILSEALHSSSDLLASFIAYFSVTKSTQPADSDHPFGHEKYEDFSGLLEGGLIFLAGFYIIYEAIKKIITPLDSALNVDLGLWVMMISIVINFLVSRYLFKTAQKHDSMALFADAEHLNADIYSSLGVLAGLLIVKLTSNPIFDAITALFVACLIFFTAYKVCAKSAANLLDTALCKEDNEAIKEVVNKFVGDKIISVKHIRSRKSGGKKNIELTLIADRHLQIGNGHELCDEIEAEIEKSLGNTDITIHLEPN